MGSMRERPPMFPAVSRGRPVLVGALICVPLPEGEAPQAGAEPAADGPAGAVGPAACAVPPRTAAGPRAPSGRRGGWRGASHARPGVPAGSAARLG